MLRTTKLTKSGTNLSKYYTEKENYYYAQRDGVESLSGGQGHIRVHGLLAQRLGFAEGESLTQQQFLNLLSGRDAAGEKVTRDHKVLGYDMTFSAPKSVSIAGLLTLKDPRIIAAHDRAVVEALKEFERQLAGTMPRAGQHEKTGNLAFVTVRDGFNRDHDPHLHTHVVIPNMTQRGDKIMALDGSQFLTKDFNHLWGGLYRFNLACQLKELGYSLTYTKEGELRMDVVSLELEEVFSKRGREIEALMRGGMDHKEAFLENRKKKNPKVKKKDELARWELEVAKVKEKTLEQNRQEAVLARDKWYAKATYNLEARQELAGERQTTEAGRWQLAARRATDKTACATAEAVITEYLKELGRTEAWQGITYQELELRFKGEVDAGRILRMDDGRYTTWEMTRADRECLELRPAAPGLVLSEDLTKLELAAYHDRQTRANQRTLSAEQTAAAAGILSADRGTVVVQGGAGSGKTTLLRAVQDVAERAGWDLVGVSVAGAAASKLQVESEIKSRTLASYLAQERAAAKGSATPAAARRPRLIVLDEASMLGSRELAELQGHAQRHNDKLVLVGDRHQLQSVGAGKPFDRLVMAAEASRELIVLKENHRQKNQVLIKAADLARQGRMRECLDVLDADKRIIDISDDTLRRERIAELYDSRTLVMTGSNQSREALNEHIRRRLLAKGELDARTARRYELAKEDANGVSHAMSRQLVKGERVVLTKNEHTLYDVDNGNCGTITKLGEKRIGVLLEDGREIELDLARYKHLDYGYALTIYKGQGQSYDKKISEADMRMPWLHDRSSTYVLETRARYESLIFTNNRLKLYEAARVQSVKRDTLELGVALSKARQMEARLQEMARKEALVKAFTGPDLAREIRPGRELPAPALERDKDLADRQLEQAKEQTLVISNATLLKATRGVKRLEAAVAKDCKAVEDRLKARADLTPELKQRIAAYFARPEAADVLMTEKISADAKIAAAELSIKTREKEYVCAHLLENEKTAVLAYIRPPQELTRDRQLQKERGLEFGR